MIRQRPRHRTRTLLAFAFLLSIIVHLAGGALWGLFARTLARMIPASHVLASLQEPPPAPADIVRLERRPAALPRQAHEDRAAVPAPRPHPNATVAPSLPRPRHEIARLTPRAAPQPPAVHAQRAPVDAPHRAKPLVAEPAPLDHKPAFSDRQLAQLGETFAKTIADSHQTLAGVQAAAERAPVETMKHYTVHFTGIHEGLSPGDGEIYEVSKQRIGDTVWYYTRYTYIHSDGTYEADSIPWPFHYPVGDDPFARHDKRIPLQPPPSGFKPDRPLKPILAQFFGGPAVTD